MDAASNARTQEIDALKLVYYEIVDGSSFDVDTKLYIKHFSERENHLLLRKKEELLHFYTQKELPNETELLKRAITNEEWTQAQEDKILEIRYLISDNEKNLSKIIPQQKRGIEGILQQKKEELNAILLERQQTIGKSLEDLVNEDMNDYISYLSFYKDKACKEPILPTYERYSEQDAELLGQWNVALSKHCAKINEEAIENIACMPFFLNRLSYCKENIQAFLGISLCDLTYHQTSLLSLGSRNLTVLGQAKGHPPDINLCQTLNEVSHWYAVQYSLMITKQNQV